VFFCSASAAFTSVRVCDIPKDGNPTPGRNNFWGSSGMNRTPRMASRKRKLATPERTARTPSVGDAQETSSFVSSLQALMSEVQLLREEQRRTQQEFTETLRKRDAEIQRLQQASHGFEQISISNNLDYRGSIRVARSCSAKIARSVREIAQKPRKSALR